MSPSKIISAAVILAVCLGGYFYWTINHSNTISIADLADAKPPDSNTLSSRVISRADLPPEGTRSLFDHLIAQNDGLPYPFDKLITLLQDLSPDKQAPLSVLIPSGRSILKGQADNTLPRIVAAADFQGPNTPFGLGMSTQGQLFLGFVEGANEIEVLSYNEGAGRFEFQLVQNYCEGCVPRIVYARRAICLSCHQSSAAPIFSQRPWSETNGQLAVSKAISHARGNSEPYWGVPITQPLAVPERIDELTDVGNFYVVSQRLWLDGCGEAGNACRRQMLSLALRYADNPGQFDTESAEVQQLKNLMASSFPGDGIEVSESDLRNRDPSGENKDFTDWLYELFTTEISFGEGAKDNEDLSAFDKLPPLRPLLDPLTPRTPKKVLTKNDIDGVYGIARFFTDADLKTLNKHSNYRLASLLEKVDNLPDTLFAPLPFSRISMMEALIGTKQNYCCLDTSEMSAPQVSGVPPLEIEKHLELSNFEQYCFTCHRGNPSKRLDFMAGENEQVVLENIQAKVEIREALDWERYEGTDKASKIMPPKDSVQYAKLKQAEDQARKEMRDAVPSLFSF